MKDTTELLDAAIDDIDNKHYERAIAIAAVAQAVSLADINTRLGRVVTLLDVIESNLSERGIVAAYQAGYAAAEQKDREDDEDGPDS